MHRCVLVSRLPGFDEAAQRIGHLIDGSGRRGSPRPIARHHQHRIERTGHAGTGGRVGFRRQGVAGELEAAVQRARLLTVDDPTDGVTRPLDLVDRGLDLDVEHAVGDLAGQHKAERRDHCQRESKSQRDHSQLQRSAPGNSYGSTQRTHAARHGARAPPTTPNASPRAHIHVLPSAVSPPLTIGARVTEVRPCIPLLERSTPQSGSQGLSQPWPADVGRARSPGGYPPGAGIPRPVRAAHHE